MAINVNRKAEVARYGNFTEIVVSSSARLPLIA
jgi:hypothetical protein